MHTPPIYILGIESSCDETAASVTCNERVLSNVIASQKFIHQYFGGVVPELASRAHLQKIIPVVEEALLQAKITKNDLNAVAFTRGPGLIGALLVGVTFAKALALALDVPLIEVNHMQGHVLAHFIIDNEKLNSKNAHGKKHESNSTTTVTQPTTPAFPFLCLTVSGGHTQIIRVDDHLDMTILGETLDDAAGEAFDKAAKILGLEYPGGPLVDVLAKNGNPNAYLFPHPQIENLNFSFSGLKTAFLYFIQKQLKTDPSFIDNNKSDICASIQQTIVDILVTKLIQASMVTGIKEIAIAGGVSANSGLRSALAKQKEKLHWNVYLPDFAYCTDNAAMIAITGYYKYRKKIFTDQTITPLARMSL